MSDTQAELERFAKQAFVNDVERIDAGTRATLASARRRAIEALPVRRLAIDWRAGAGRTGPTWTAAGIAATVALALAVVLRLDAPEVAESPDFRLAAGEDLAIVTDAATNGDGVDLIGSAAPLIAPADLELLAGGPDVLDVLEEDLEFYAWLEQQPELRAISEGRER